MFAPVIARFISVSEAYDVVTIELVRENTVRQPRGRRETDSLREAIELARSGEAAAARQLLVAVCRKNKECELGWFWLAAVARNPSEQLACIKQVLRINPANVSAREWLLKLRDMGVEKTAAAAPARTRGGDVQPVVVAAPSESPKSSSSDVARLSDAVQREAVQHEMNLPAETATDKTSVEAPETESGSRMDAAPAPQQNEEVATTEAVVTTEPPAAETTAPVRVSSAFPSLYEEEIPPVAEAAPESVEVEPAPAPAAVEPVESTSAVAEAPPADERIAGNGPTESLETEPETDTVSGDDVTASDSEPVSEVAAEPEVEIELVVESTLAPVTQYIAVPPAGNQTDHTFPHLDQTVAAEPPPFPAPAVAELSIAPEHRFAETSQPESIEPPPQVAVTAESAAYVPPPVIAGAILPHNPQLDTLAQLPAVEAMAAAEPAVAEFESQPPVPRCGICEAVLTKPAHCDSCKSMNWPINPLDFVLNRNVDHELLQGVVDRLQVLPRTAENELRIALAYCNLHRFDQARHHLERAAILDFETVSVAIERVGGFLDRPTILVVDDSATIREVLIRILGRESFLPIPIGNSWEVVAVAKSQRPAVILLDVTMPFVDGYEVCRQIRADRETKAIPVVMVSGHTDLIDKVVAKLAGASDYLNKPFSADQLMNTVRFYAAKKR